MIEDENSKPTNIDVIKEMIKDNKIEVTEVPKLLYAERSRILIDQRGPVLTIDTTKLCLFETQVKEMTPTEKLKFDGYGHWEFNATMVHSAYFPSRQELNEFLVNQYVVDLNKAKHYKSDKISIDELGTMGTMKRFSLNLDYYLSNWEELEKNLGRKVDKNRERTEAEWKLLSDELFYNLMCSIFGGPLPIDEQQGKDGQKKFMITDFQSTLDGTLFHASGRRGKFYILFIIVTV